MVITFLVGNGFDIGLGLQTGYEDFYKKYCVPSDKDDDNIADFKKMLSQRQDEKQKKIIDWADFEKAFGQHSSDFNLQTKKDYLDRFKNFVISFNAYLEEQEKGFMYADKKKISEIMHTAVTTFYNIQPADRDEIHRFFGRFNSQRIYNFVSFNYTKTLDNCVDTLNERYRTVSNLKVESMVHLHGQIEQSMIMGVNDASQITNSELAADPEVMGMLVKPQQNANVRTNNEKQAMKAINASDIICIYGMSIGETDKKWWRIIAEWLAKSEHHVLVILRHDKEYNPRFTFNQTEHIGATISRFLTLANLPEKTVEAIHPRIYVGMNHDVFQIDMKNMVLKEVVDNTVAMMSEAKV